MKITFANPADITVSPAVTKQVSEINVERMVDSPNRKTVVAHTREFGAVQLWKGDEYDAIGQWTDTDVVNKLKQLYPY